MKWKAILELILDGRCHKKSKTKETGFIDISGLRDADEQVLSMRVYASVDHIKKVCQHHNKVFLQLFAQKTQNAAIYSKDMLPIIN